MAGRPGYKRLNLILATAVGLCFGVDGLNAQTAADSSLFGVFAGSSPSGESIRPLLQIAPDANADLIEWKLTLYQDAKSAAPTSYRLRCDYGPAVAGLPGLGSWRSTVQREGSWTISKGIQSNPNAVVYELHGAVSLVEVDPDVLHVLNRDRSLMVGTGGWSYTLNRTEPSEKPRAPSLAEGSSDVRPYAYTLSPVAKGPSAFGVFEGRSPCQGIARELKIDAHSSCIKIKWRVTLNHNPETLTPTTYKLEDTLHRQRAREGTWTIVGGTETNPNAIVYRLAPTQTEAALFLLRGDDDVLFFLNQNRKPLVGNAEFSYTLNRRKLVLPSSPEARH